VQEAELLELPRKPASRAQRGQDVPKPMWSKFASWSKPVVVISYAPPSRPDQLAQIGTMMLSVGFAPVPIAGMPGSD